MPRNPNRYPKTPEGLAKQAHDMTQNGQPVGFAIRPHSKKFTKEAYLNDIKNQIIQEEKEKGKRVGPFKVRTKRNMDAIAQMLLEYSLKETSFDMPGFLRIIDMSPQNFLRMTKVDKNLADTYERAKSNFANNNLNFLYASVNNIALSRSAYLHGVYSALLGRELRKEKSFDKKLSIKAINDFTAEKKAMSASGESDVKYRITIEY